MSERQPLSPRTRFEVFKRDNFTCRYCGGKSPNVVLEIDHIVAVANGGSNDEMNLATSCYLCNRGKSDKPLSEAITGKDPHDRSIELLEREQQMKEYNVVLEEVEDRISQDLISLQDNFGWALTGATKTFIRSSLRHISKHDVNEALELAFAKTDGRNPACVKYFCGIIRNWIAMGGKEKSEKAYDKLKKIEGVVP